MNNHQQSFQNLKAISALNVLEDEAAATCSGGADVELFVDANFQGESLQVSSKVTDLSNYSVAKVNNVVTYRKSYDNKISSIKVNSGVWQFFSEPNFQGPSVTLGAGEYSGVTEVGIDNDSLSSVRRIE